MSLTYNQALQALQTLGWIPLNNEDENFQRIIPRIFEYAENRIYREHDWLATITSQTTPLTANNRNMTMPATVILLNSLNVITPVATAADAGLRHPLERISIQAMDMFWPSATLTPTVPTRYSIIGTSVQGFTIRLSPTPDQAYNAEFIGVIRPAILTPTNTTTYLSLYYPDLFIAACMIFIAGYQRDYGSQADDPAKAMSWEKQYQTLSSGATLEAARQMGEARGWTAQAPAPVAENRPAGA